MDTVDEVGGRDCITLQEARGRRGHDSERESVEPLQKLASETLQEFFYCADDGYRDSSTVAMEA